MIKISIRNSFLAGLSLSTLAACAVTEPYGEAPQVDVEDVERSIAGEATLDSSSVVGFSTEGIAALEKSMGDYVSNGRLYGIHTRLARKGEIVSDYRAGVRALETGAPIEDDTIYRIYSMTKPITGVAMMTLWEEGKFSLDDPVTKFVPEFENLKVLSGVNDDGSPIVVDMDRPPTMRELMSHTSGFAYGLGGDDPANNAFRDLKVLESPDLQTFIDRTARIPLMFQPGEHWYYSAGMDIQGYIIEKLSGQTFGEYLQTRLFQPLGMTDTGFYVPEEDRERFSDVFGFHPETLELVTVPYRSVEFRKDTVAYESGGGGLVSTMNDYSRFAQMLVNGGELNGVRILEPETIELMSTDVLPDGVKLYIGTEPMDGLGMGLTVGTVTDRDAVPTPGPNGAYFWSGAASTWFWIDPVNELYFIGMVQVFNQDNPDGHFPLREDSAEAVYGALIGETE